MSMMALALLAVFLGTVLLMGVFVITAVIDDYFYVKELNGMEEDD